MATTMMEIPIKDLALTTAPTGKQLLVRDASAGLQRIDYAQIAKNLVESYGSSSLAGKNQSIKAAIDSLNSGLTQNTRSISTINDSLSNINKGHEVFSKSQSYSIFKRVGSIVTVSCTQQEYQKNVKTIPYGYHPTYDMYISIYLNKNGGIITLLNLSSNGTVSIQNNSIMNENIGFIQNNSQITNDNYPT